MVCSILREMYNIQEEFWNSIDFECDRVIKYKDDRLQLCKLVLAGVWHINCDVWILNKFFLLNKYDMWRVNIK